MERGAWAQINAEVMTQTRETRDNDRQRVPLLSLKLRLMVPRTAQMAAYRDFMEATAIAVSNTWMAPGLL
jgi:hypothetical protein